MKYTRFVALMSLFLCGQAMSQQASPEKIIYRWSDENGAVYYSHIKPMDGNDLKKIGGNGQEIVSHSNDFDQVDVIIRPSDRPNVANEEGIASSKNNNANNKVKDQNKEAELETESKESAAAVLKKKNCVSAKKNATVLEGGEVYEKDDAGNLVPLDDKAIKIKLENTQKYIDYFCND